MHYDLLGRTYARDANAWLQSVTLDALGRPRSQQLNVAGTIRTNGFLYDTGGRLERHTYPDNLYVTYDYFDNGAAKTIRENGSLALATFGYDDLGRRKTLTRGNGAVTRYDYDSALRLDDLRLDLAGTQNDLVRTLAYNPAGQITGRSDVGNAYGWGGAVSVSRSYATNNGRNQYDSAGGVAFQYDLRGNLTHSGSEIYGYNTRNALVSNMAGQLFYRGPLGQLNRIVVAHNQATNFDQLGMNLMGEYDYATGTLLRRYVHGPGVDEPLVWYEGAGLTDRRYLHADERGSVVAVTGASGAVLAINAYDEYGIPSPGNIGRFQYTGQKWIPELGMYDYKARTYSPTLGRFLQTDPIGYADGMNWYAYVGNDPVNGIDPTGMACKDPKTGADCPNDDGGGGGDTIVVVAGAVSSPPIGPSALQSADFMSLINSPPSQSLGNQALLQIDTPQGEQDDIVVTANAVASPRVMPRPGLGLNWPSIIIDNIMGYPLASGMLPPHVLAAQNNRQTRKKIASLQAHIREHEAKIANNPRGPSVGHYQAEINAAKATIERLQRRLPNGR